MFNLSITVPAASLASNKFTGFENNSSVTVTIVRGGDLDSDIVVRLKTAQMVGDNAAISEGYAYRKLYVHSIHSYITNILILVHL